MITETNDPNAASAMSAANCACAARDVSAANSASTTSTACTDAEGAAPAFDAIRLVGRRDVAVLFDFNGVLVDDEPVHFQSFQEVLAAHGQQMRADEYRRYLGFDDRETFAAFARDRRIVVSPARLDSWAADKQAAYAARTRDGVHLFPGARDLVVALGRAGVPLAIVSGARRAEIDVVLRTAGLAACFPIVVAAEDVARPKPDPGGYRLGFQRLCARFPRLRAGVAVEDAPAGVAAARAAGLACIGVTTSCTPAELSAAGRIIDSLKQLRLVTEEAAS